MINCRINRYNSNIRFLGLLVCKKLSYYIKNCLKSWELSSESERLAWRQLGVDKNNWKFGELVIPNKLAWNNLNDSQKAAVIYGLQLTEDQWNGLPSNFVKNEQIKPLQDLLGIKVANPSSSSNVFSSTIKTVLNFAPIVAELISSIPIVKKNPILSMAIKAAASSLSNISDETSESIIVQDIETVLYLDDSGSMYGSNLSKGQSLLNSMWSSLSCNLRIVKFGTYKTVLSERSENISVLPEVTTNMMWNAQSGLTYMWHMILNDIQQKYRPGSGKLRIVIITDGYDCQSPGEYNGINGMNPMMRDLLGAGFDIEWFIVIIGSISSTELKKYKSLATATGGAFLVTSDDPIDSIINSFNKNDSDEIQFLETLKSSGGPNSFINRRTRQNQYKLSADKGELEKFNWITLLPPPKR